MDIDLGIVAVAVTGITWTGLLLWRSARRADAD